MSIKPHKAIPVAKYVKNKNEEAALDPVSPPAAEGGRTGAMTGD